MSRIAEITQTEYEAAKVAGNEVKAAAIQAAIEIRFWETLLTDREKKEVAFCETYVADFQHGTAGHNRMCLINKLAQILEGYETVIASLIEEYG